MARNSSWPIKEYCTSCTSPVLGALVVKETECSNPSRSSPAWRQRVVFPAPDGADTTKRLPFLFNISTLSCTPHRVRNTLGYRFYLKCRKNDVVAVGDDNGPCLSSFGCIDKLSPRLSLFPHLLYGQ